MSTSECLGCQVAVLTRSNAILRVSKTAPNPKWLARYEVLRASGEPEAAAKAGASTMVVKTVKRVNGRYVEGKAYIDVSPTVPNPAFDSETRRAMMLPVQCDLHIQLAEEQLRNKLLAAQRLNEETELACRAMEKATPGLVIPRSLPLPIGNLKTLRDSPLADGKLWQDEPLKK